MKKLTLIILIPILILSTKKNKIYYIPFDIPGSQMAATIPPLGTFIENNYEGNISILKHEKIHWIQYEKMGFFGFYSTYLSEYIKFGRIYGPMEVEARKLSKN